MLSDCRSSYGSRPMGPRLLSGLAGLLAVIALAACGGSSTSSSSRTNPTAPDASTTSTSSTAAYYPANGIGYEGIRLEEGPQIAPAGTTLPGTTVDGIHCAPVEQLAYHIHAHLAVFVDGRPVPAAGRDRYPRIGRRVDQLRPGRRRRQVLLLASHPHRRRRDPHRVADSTASTRSANSSTSGSSRCRRPRSAASTATSARSSTASRGSRACGRSRCCRTH